MENKENMISKTSKIQEIVRISLMAAIVYLATSVIHINSFNGVIHAGDSMVFVAAIMLGRKKGAVASGLGMFLFDLAHGYLSWAPFTLVIKAVMAWIAGYMWYRKEESSKLYHVLALALAGIWMIGAYYVSGAFIKLLFTGEGFTLKEAFIISSYDIPGNILQVLVGMLIALPLSKIPMISKVASK